MVTNAPNPDDTPDRACSSGGFSPRFRESLLSNPVLLAAYAASLIILALGLVAVIILVIVLCFFFPEKANTFLTVFLGGPLAALLVLHSRGAKEVTVRLMRNGKSDIK